MTIIADSNQIEQVLINLVTNAVDAMQKGGRLTIKTDVEEMKDSFKKEHGFGTSGEYGLIIVSDTGTGMTESIKEKIFIRTIFYDKRGRQRNWIGAINSQGILEEGFNFISKVALPDEILLKIREVLDK